MSAREYGRGQDGAIAIRDEWGSAIRVAPEHGFEDQDRLLLTATDQT